MVALALAGCGGGAAVDRTPGPPPCATITRAEHPADTVTVVLFDQVDLSHAPWGRNREERFVFSHLYETLVTIDCNGVAQCSLAKSCIEASDGWLIELRDDARFWDDTPVTAQDVVESFKPAIPYGVAVGPIDVINERTVLVHGPKGRPDIRMLTLPMFSIVKPAMGSGPIIGTGSWMMDRMTPIAGAVAMYPVTGESPVVCFVQRNVSKARDVIDGSADAMVTDDPTAIEYARTNRRGALTPLAWDQVYVLLSTTRATRLRNNEHVEAMLRATTDGLARDAVRVDARGGSSLFVDSERAQRIQVASAGFPVLPGVVQHDKLVVVRSNSPTARSLAERIVALAAMDTSKSADARTIVRAVPDAGLRPLRVVPSSAAEFESSLKSGAQFAYVDVVSWCADFPTIFHRFGNRAPWLLMGGTISQNVVPLVETRAHFVSMSDRIGFVDDHNGNVRIMIHTAERRR